jgi:hypothetical protein
MIDKKTLKKAVAAPLDNVGFVRKGQSWYLNGEDAIVVLNLQKSDWSEMYFMNIGIWLKALGEAVFPKENVCHLSYRAESLFPDQRQLVLEGLSLDSSNSETLSEIADFIKEHLIPFLKDCTYESNLRKFLQQGILERGLVRIEAREYLNG